MEQLARAADAKKRESKSGAATGRRTRRRARVREREREREGEGFYGERAQVTRRAGTRDTRSRLSSPLPFPPPAESICARACVCVCVYEHPGSARASRMLKPRRVNPRRFAAPRCGTRDGTSAMISAESFSRGGPITITRANGNLRFRLADGEISEIREHSRFCHRRRRTSR